MTEVSPPVPPCPPEYVCLGGNVKAGVENNDHFLCSCYPFPINFCFEKSRLVPENLPNMGLGFAFLVLEAIA